MILKFLIVNLLIFSLFVSCNVLGNDCNSPSEIASKILDSTISECQPDAIGKFSEILNSTIEKFDATTPKEVTARLAKLIPNSRTLFSSKTKTFSDFLSDGINSVPNLREKFPSTSKKEINEAFLVYTNALQKEFKTDYDLTKIEGFIEAGITDAPTLKKLFPDADFSDYPKITNR